MRSFCSSLLICFIFAASSLAQNTLPDEAAGLLENFLKDLERFRDLHARGSWTLIEDGREPRIRELDFMLLVGDNGSRFSSRATFLAPKDISGTRLLYIVEDGGRTEAWTYLPEIGRVATIDEAMPNRSLLFMPLSAGLGLTLGGDPEFRWIGEAPCASDRRCQVIELERSAVTDGKRILLWFDAEEGFLSRVEVTSPSGHLIRIVIFRKYRRYLAGGWVARYMRLEDRVAKLTSILQWKEIEVNTGISTRFFTPKGLYFDP